jgi:hypothetical protein
MAAPVASYIKIPFDGGNLGKNVRYNTRVIGSDTVYEQLWSREEPVSTHYGFYCCNVGVPSAIVATAQDGTTTGFFWFENAVGSTKLLRLARLTATFTNAIAAGAIDHDSAPRILFVRSTFAGAFSGAQATICKRKTADSTPQATVRTAPTSATVTLGNTHFVAVTPGNDFETAGILNIQNRQEWKPKFEDEFFVLAAGECLTVYQADNGTTNDQRLVMFGLAWEEIDAA